MITFFTHCRAFEGEFADIQECAIESWKSLPHSQVILMGDDSVKEAAKQLNVEHVLISGYNEYGTALVNAMFKAGESRARHPLCCEISSDIVITITGNRALRTIMEIDKPFVIGQRWDVTPGEAESAKKHAPSAVDYFIYRRGTLGEIPPFAVGRTAYDQWLVWAAQERWGLQTIDATEDIFAVHINHGYPEYGSKEKMRQSKEREQNIRLAQNTGCQRWYGTNDTQFVLQRGEVIERANLSDG